jgi:hypothetical protein
MPGQTQLFAVRDGCSEAPFSALDEVLGKMEREIRLMFPDRIEVQMGGITDGPLPKVALAPAQAQDLIRHLVIDALDAMPGAGTLLISVGQMTAGMSYPPLPADLAWRRWVLLSVCDTGSPCCAAKRHSLLDKGRALGLSAAYEALQEAGGYLSVALRQHETAVHIYFPVQETKA